MARRAWHYLLLHATYMPFLDQKSLHLVSQVLAVSHMDYCNACYMELLLKNI